MLLSRAEGSQARLGISDEEGAAGHFTRAGEGGGDFILAAYSLSQLLEDEALSCRGLQLAGGFIAAVYQCTMRRFVVMV